MTKQRDLKTLIRERMAKTGESYASARRALVRTTQSEAEPPAKKAASAPVVPTGWIATGQAPSDYEFSVDRTESRTSSRPSAVIRSVVDTPRSFGTLMQEFVPDHYRGRRVRFSAWVRTTDVAGHSKLWMRVDADGSRVLAFGQSPLVSGTTDWRQLHVVLDVAEDAAVLAFGLFLNGAGSAWIDGVALELVGDEVPTTNARPLPHAPTNLGFDE